MFSLRFSLAVALLSSAKALSTSWKTRFYSRVVIQNYTETFYLTLWNLPNFSEMQKQWNHLKNNLSYASFKQNVSVGIKSFIFCLSKYNSWVSAHSCQDHRRERPCGKTPCYNILIEKKLCASLWIATISSLQLIPHYQITDYWLQWKKILSGKSRTAFQKNDHILALNTVVAV